MRTATFWRLSGLIAAVIFLVLYLIAMSLDNGYAFGRNYLSDLGVRQGAWAFNSGLIIGGALFVVFALLGLGPELGGNLLGKVVKTMMLISAALLISLGIFTEDSGRVHTVISYSFFLETLVALLIVDLALYRSRSLGVFGPGISSACLIFGFGLLPFGGTPLVETLAVLDILAWGVLISMKLSLKRD